MGLESPILAKAAPPIDASAWSLHHGAPLPFPLGQTQFLVTVDTEEAFDWTGPFTRDQHSVSHIPAVLQFQELCDKYGVQPIYMVDYPVLTDPQSQGIFKTLIREKRAIIGAHLHPWVTPPFDDEVNRHNSYGCNLPEKVERDKLMVMLDAMNKVFGEMPKIFRAGRYGIGENTAEVLIECGVPFDSSVRSYFDYSAEGGPDFGVSSVRPYWIRPGQLAELPLTSVFVGPLRRYAPHLFGRDSKPAMTRGVLARSGLLSRIAFTPEGVDLRAMKKGIDCAMADGLPLLNLSFHSPSLEPGNTAYVQNAAQQEAFLGWWDSIFAYLAQKSVRPASLDDLSAAFAA